MGTEATSTTATGATDAATTTTTATPADAAAAAAAAATPPAAAAPAAGAGEPGAPVLDPSKPDQDPANAPWNDPVKAEAMIRQLQKEAGDNRIKAKTAEETQREKAMQDAARLVLGIEPEGDKAPTVEQLGAAVAEQRASAATAMAAWSNGVDPAQAELLEFKLSRHAEFKALDTTAPDYQAKVGTIVAALVAADASLKATAGPVQRSSVDNLGGTEGASTITPEAFASMSMADRTALKNTDRATYDRLVAGQ